MGFKAVKEHYEIGHTVHVNKKGEIVISSPYVDLLKINQETGKITYERDDFVDALYVIKQDQFKWVFKILEDSKNGVLKQVIDKKDNFGELQDCFTVSDYKVVKKQCEKDKMEWPNCCTDGEIIYDNTFFATEKEAKEELIKNSLYSMFHQVENTQEKIADLQKRNSFQAQALLGFIKGLGLEEHFEYRIECIEAILEAGKK
jgi:hypothetical protein